MATIRLPNTPQNRYVKEVFDYLLANHRNGSFGYSDIPGDSTAEKSNVMVILKQLGLRESVALQTFELTDKAKNTQIEVS